MIIEKFPLTSYRWYTKSFSSIFINFHQFSLSGEGAFTGEVSAGQVADAGIKLLGVSLEPPWICTTKKPLRNREMNGDTFISGTAVSIWWWYVVVSDVISATWHKRWSTSSLTLFFQDSPFTEWFLPCNRTQVRPGGTLRASIPVRWNRRGLCRQDEGRTVWRELRMGKDKSHQKTKQLTRHCQRMKYHDDQLQGDIAAYIGLSHLQPNQRRLLVISLKINCGAMNKPNKHE